MLLADIESKCCMQEDLNSVFKSFMCDACLHIFAACFFLKNRDDIAAENPTEIKSMQEECHIKAPVGINDIIGFSH